MTLPADVFSCCCDWGFEFYTATSSGFWYFSTTAGTLRKRSKSDLSEDSVSTFANASRLVLIDDEDSFYYYPLTLSAVTVRKYQFDGTEIWNYSPGTGRLLFNSPHIIAVDSDKNVYFAFEVNLGGLDPTQETVRVVKLDANGDEVWTTDITPPELGPAGTSTFLQPLGVCVDLDGHVHITGRRAVSNNGPPQTNRTHGGFEVHLDANGDEVWSDLSTNVNTGNEESYGQQCVCDESGNIIVRYNPYLTQTNTTDTTDKITLKGYAQDGTPLFTHKRPGTGVGAETEFPVTSLIQYLGGKLYCSGEFIPAVTGNAFYARYSGSDYATEDWTNDLGVSATARFTLDNNGFMYGHHVSGSSVIFHKLAQSDGSEIDSLTQVSPGFTPFYPMSPPGLPVQFMT